MSDKKDPKKLLFFLPIPLLLIFFVYLFFFNSKDESNQEQLSTTQNVSFEMPDVDNKDIYSSKIKAYERHRKDSIRNVNMDDGIGSTFGNLGKDDVNKNKINLDGVIEDKSLVNKIDTTNTRVKKLNNIIDKINSQNNSKLKPINRKPERKVKPKVVYKVVAQTPVAPKRTKKRYNASGKKSHYKTIQAVVHGQQKVYNRSKLKLRITKDVRVDGQLLKKNTFIYGLVRFNEERVNVEIASIVYKDEILPVKYKLYDRDGILGIYIPGGITQDASQNVSNDAIDQMSGSSVSSGSMDLIGKVGKAVSKWNKNAWANIPNDYKVILK